MGDHSKFAVCRLRYSAKALFFTGLLLIFSLSYPAGFCYAAGIPDAGSILRDQQSQKELPRQLPASEKTQERASTAETGVQVEVKQFIFSGYEGLATEGELQKIVAGSIAKNLTFEELNALTDKVTALFKKKGWFQARAYLPPQDITSGIIQIAITQVKSDGQISIKPDKTCRINADALRSIGILALHSGEPIKELDLERSILIMNDLPGISAKASLIPGAAPGSSSVEVAVTEGPLVSGVLWGDNYSNRYTGTWRGNTILSINDPIHHGDQITLLLTEASGLSQGRVGYSIPIAYNGLRANLAYSGMRYELGSDLASLQYKGNSNSIDGGLSYPLIRTRNANLTTSLSYGYRGLIDTKSDIDIRDKTLNNATLSVNGDRYDQLFGGGYSSYNASITTGKLHESVADISLTGTEGNYTRFNYGLTRLQHLAEQLNFNLSVIAQSALCNLDTSEKFVLGGPNGVRAYPVGEASGDEGQLINADVRYTLPFPAKWGNFQLSGFYDAGHITINKNRYPGDVSSATGSNDYWLLGAGAGLSYSSSGRLSLRATWAQVIGENAGRSTAGNNSDGRSDRNQFWLQSIFSF